MIREIVVKLTFEGVHCWPDCPFEDVSFLKNPHRHLFYIECHKEVNHNDRDIEIILFKRGILNYLNKKYPDKDLGTKSCEMLAEELVNQFILTSCIVLEDNENGAKISK